jgi:hypothetical protein
MFGKTRKEVRHNGFAEIIDVVMFAVSELLVRGANSRAEGPSQKQGVFSLIQ